MDTNYTEIVFLDVGQGDGTLIVCPKGETILIDFGSIKNARVAAADAIKYLKTKLLTIQGLRSLPNPTIDALFLTHPDRDHYNQLKDLCDAFTIKPLDIKKVYIGGQPGFYKEDGVNTAVIGPASDDGCLYEFERRDHYESGTKHSWSFSDGEVKLYLLCVNARGYTGNPNDMSIVLKLTFAKRSVIFAGDARDYSERLMLGWYESAFLKSDVLKLGHHGSASSSIKAWVETVQPCMAFASADMTWAHPYCTTIERFSANECLWPIQDHLWLCGQGRGIKKEYFNHYNKCGVYTTIAYQIQIDEKLMRESEKALNKRINKIFNPKGEDKDGLVAGGQYNLLIQRATPSTSPGKFQLSWVLPSASDGTKPFGEGTGAKCTDVIPPPVAPLPLPGILDPCGCF